MQCERCGGEVTWRGPFSALTHTECSSCGGINCQRVTPQDEPDFGPEPCQSDDAPKDNGAQWKREVSRYGSASLQSLILARLQQKN